MAAVDLNKMRNLLNWDNWLGITETEKWMTENLKSRCIKSGYHCMVMFGPTNVQTTPQIKQWMSAVISF
jgi:hypothetical protein